MKRDIEEPKEVKGFHADKGDSTSKAWEHPAYGVIGASRVSSNGQSLFGTDFLHRNYIVIKVRRAILDRGLSHDHHFAKGEIVTLAISEAQWATFVSSLNVGEGVPCTLESVGYEYMPLLPLRRQSILHAEELETRLERMQDVAAETMKAIDEALPNLSERKREQIMAALTKLQQDLKSNLPWYAAVFRKHMKRVVESAKIEVNAYAESIILKTGLAALWGGKENTPIRMLDEADDVTPPSKRIGKGK